MRWQECFDEHIVHHDEPSPSIISRLQTQSENTLSTAHDLDVTESTARSIALLSYDALRELLEALSHAEGYDVHNHECYRAFLQEVLGASDLARAFNELRERRNELEYDAAMIDEGDAARFRERATSVYNKAKTLLSEKQR